MFETGRTGSFDPGGSDDGYERPGRGLIEMPVPMSVLAHVGSTPRSDLASEHRTEPINPVSSPLVMGHFPTGFLGLTDACLRPDVAVFGCTV